MKKLIIIFIAAITISCNNQVEIYKEEIVDLKKRNDSLQTILTELNRKYIFDDIKVRVIPSEENTNKMGSDYNGEFVIVGYNKSTVVNFGTGMDSNNGDFVNQKKLERDFGGFPFNLTLNETENRIYFKFYLNGEYGNKSFDGFVFADNKKVK